jgi:hypothetical protein
MVEKPKLSNQKKPVMKNRFSLGMILLMLLQFGCQQEEHEPDRPKGLLKVKIGLFISVHEVNSQLKSTLGPEDFKVCIYRTGGDAVLTFERASEMPPEIEIETGTYYVTAFSDNDLPAAFENPYYFGASEPFTILAGATQSVVINCELANTMVSVVYSENIRSTFSSYNTLVSSSAGSLTFGAAESRPGYFRTLPLAITATLTYVKTDGTTEQKTLTGTIPDPQPKKHYEIYVDAGGPGGALMFDIHLDEDPDPVEIVQITDQNNPPGPGELPYGSLLITEIMADPASLSDTEGEWFEIYNNTDHAIDLQHLIIKKNENERHVISQAFILDARSFGILARTDAAVAVGKYVYGTAITLNNTGGLLSLCNSGEDGIDGSVIFAVDYGAEDFPHLSGASISLDPGSLTPSAAILGINWCVSAVAYGTGDLGTPGAANDPCH